MRNEGENGDERGRKWSSADNMLCFYPEPEIMRLRRREEDKLVRFLLVFLFF